MTGKRLSQYVGELSAEQIATGVNLTQRNARRLADDAIMMLDAGRLPTAVALAILSIEEAGKRYVLRRLALATDAAGQKKAWREFRQHTAKNGHWVLPGIAMDGGRRLRDFRAAVEVGEHSYIADMVKQIAVYADCLGSNANWSDPEVVIHQELADQMVGTADALAGSEVVSVREIELWIEHVRPHVGTPDMVRAVLAYATAVHAEGLSTTKPEQVAAFMEGMG